jgi:hypothetical protein
MRSMGVFQFRDKAMDAAEIGRGVQLERVPMSTGELDERLGWRRRLEQPSAVGERNHVIGSGVQKQLRDGDPGDLVY